MDTSAGCRCSIPVAGWVWDGVLVAEPNPRPRREAKPSAWLSDLRDLLSPAWGGCEGAN